MVKDSIHQPSIHCDLHRRYLLRSHKSLCTVDCTQLYSGKTSRFERSDILGTIAPEKLPEWAKHYLEIVRQAEKKAKDKEGR